MTPSSPADAATVFWRRRARWTALRHNFGRVLGGFLPACLGVSAVFACGLLLVRQRGTVGAAWWSGYGAALLACAALAAWHAGRRGFFTVADARVRLESHLGLHNRLSAAAAGVGAFPPPQAAPDGYGFRWQTILPPLAGALVLVLGAGWVPVTPPAAPDLAPETLPAAWSRTAQWLDALQKTDLVQPPALEDFHERLAQLAQQSARDWYSQSSLEAGDHLRGQAEQSLQALQRDLRTAASSLETMERLPENVSPAEAKALAQRLQEAVKGLEMGNLPLNKELLSQLKGLDLSKLKSLTPSQLEQLRKRLKDGVKITEATLRPGKPGDKDGDLALVGVPTEGPSAENGEPGGTGGGTSSAPLDLKDKPTQLHSAATEPDANASSLDHALPGDLIGVGQGEHTVDPSKYQGPTAAGLAASEGTGGEAVWRDDLTPQEREVLKRFYK